MVFTADRKNWSSSTTRIGIYASCDKSCQSLPVTDEWPTIAGSICQDARPCQIQSPAMPRAQQSAFRVFQIEKAQDALGRSAVSQFASCSDSPSNADPVREQVPLRTGHDRRRAGATRSDLSPQAPHREYRLVKEAV